MIRVPKCYMCGRKLPNEDKRVYSTFTKRHYCLPGARCDSLYRKRKREAERADANARLNALHTGTYKAGE